MTISQSLLPCGSVAEWSKALVLGTSHVNGVGSNPTAANLFNIISDFIFLFSMITIHTDLIVIMKDYKVG